jgi:hypothetical protein
MVFKKEFKTLLSKKKILPQKNNYYTCNKFWVTVNTIIFEGDFSLGRLSKNFLAYENALKDILT